MLNFLLIFLYVFQNYALKYGDKIEALPFTVRVVIEENKFWESLKDTLAVLRPLVDAQAKSESDDCTLGDIGACFGDMFTSFAGHSNVEERAILLDKLEKRWKTFYQPDLMVVAMFLHPSIKLTKFQVILFVRE